MSNRIITISRQYGSGGHAIGEALSEKLNIPFYDLDILAKLVEETGYGTDVIQEKGEFLKSHSWFYGVTSRNRFEINPQDIIWNATVKVVRELAEEGPCVIVGRCADYILAEHNILKVFISSDMDLRLARINKDAPEGRKLTEKDLRKKDEMRSSFYSYYTDLKWGYAGNYDISLNTKIGIDRCVEMIQSLY